jgi:hypothetical protein
MKENLPERAPHTQFARRQSRGTIISANNFDE